RRGHVDGIPGDGTADDRNRQGAQAGAHQEQPRPGVLGDRAVEESEAPGTIHASTGRKGCTVPADGAGVDGRTAAAPGSVTPIACDRTPPERQAGAFRADAVRVIAAEGAGVDGRARRTVALVTAVLEAAKPVVVRDCRVGQGQRPGVEDPAAATGPSQRK